MRAIVTAAAVALVAFFGCVPATACAQGTTQRIPGKRFEALAKPMTHSVVLNGDSELIQAYAIPDQVVPAGAATLTVGTAVTNPAYVNVPVTIDIDGKFLRQVFVGYKVVQYVHTAVASHDLVPGTVIADGDVQMARVPFNGQRINGVAALMGRRVMSAYREGQPITIESTTINQIVKAGNTVVLVVHDGGVSVVADVVARTGGGLGEQIQLWNPQTRKMLTGTITGPDRAELDIDGGAL